MKRKVFMCGAGPLPSEKGILWQTAYGLRTWQFLHAFKGEENWDIRLVLLTDAQNYKDAPKLNTWEKILVNSHELSLIHLNKDERGFEKRLRKEFMNTQADLCIGVNNLPSYFLAKLKPQIPFWADLNGWLMAEAQSAAHVYQDSSYIPTLWKREKCILENIDQASTASYAQKEASYGELASTFRLNQFTESWNFFHNIPPSNELKTDTASNYKLPLPKEAKSILFSGSYNTWLDEETLFEGLNLAMGRNKALHFVSTGSREESVNNPVLKHFLASINNSAHKERFHFLGRLDKADLLAVYEQVECAINLDRDNLETHFGARNRINEYLHYGVPTLSTTGSEFTRELAKAGVIFTLPFSDAKELSRVVNEHILQVDRKQWTKKAREYVNENYSYSKTLEPLEKWLKGPKRAPDKGRRLQLSVISKIRFRIKKDGILFLVKWCFKKIR